MLGNEPDGGSLLVVTDGAEHTRPYIREVKDEVSLQYGYLIPAPVDRTSAIAYLYKHPWVTCQNSRPRTSMNHVACEFKLRSVVRSYMHPCSLI